MASDLFKKYIWLVDTVYQHGPISFAEINRRWQRSTLCNGADIALRTFHNHREAVEELFHIRIACDDRTNRYYIENGDALGSNSIANWLLNSFSISNLLLESQALAGRVLVEEIPSSRLHLTELLSAMRENRRVQIRYQSFRSDTASDVLLQPLFVKLYERRWYLYADKADDPQIKLYALDRMQSVVITDERFKMPADFDPEAYLSGVFGVTVYKEIKPCTIRLRAYGESVRYLRTLPLHASQQEVETAPDSSVFEYFVAPTHDFYRAILSHHKQVEILSPTAVQEQIENYILDLFDRYFHVTEYEQELKAKQD